MSPQSPVTTTGPAPDNRPLYANDDIDFDDPRSWVDDSADWDDESDDDELDDVVGEFDILEND